MNDAIVKAQFEITFNFRYVSIYSATPLLPKFLTSKAQTLIIIKLKQKFIHKNVYIIYSKIILKKSTNNAQILFKYM